MYLLNIGIISNILNISLIVIGFIGLLYYSKKIMKANNDEIAKIEKVVDLFKYTLMSVAAVTIVSIVTNLFKEREQQIKELEYFDRYVGKVIQENPRERYEIAKYLSIVAPSGDFQKAWLNYFNTISTSVEYIKTDSLIKQQAIVKKDTTKSDSVKAVMLSNIQSELEIYNQPISKANISAPANIAKTVRLDIFYVENSNLILNKKAAEDLAQQLINVGYDARARMLSAEVNKKSGYKIMANELRYDNGEEEIAKAIENEINNLGNINFSKRLTANNTPNYLSFFIAN